MVFFANNDVAQAAVDIFNGMVHLIILDQSLEITCMSCFVSATSAIHVDGRLVRVSHFQGCFFKLGCIIYFRSPVQEKDSYCCDRNQAFDTVLQRRSEIIISCDFGSMIVI